MRSWKILAERHIKFELGMPGRLGPVSAIHFGGAAFGPPPGRVRMAFGLDLDDFRGRRDVQLLVRHWWPA